MWILGWMLMFAGAMLLTGEILCVEVAWRCLDYNELYVSLGALLSSTGLIVAMMGVNND
jgi:hypothetical protein